MPGNIIGDSIFIFVMDYMFLCRYDRPDERRGGGGRGGRDSYRDRRLVSRCLYLSHERTFDHFFMQPLKVSGKA